jgi:hypothetical protein
MKKITVIFALCMTFTTLSAQNAEEITRSVADQIIKNTSFKFINKKTGEKYASLKEIPSSQIMILNLCRK